jgi:Integrase core domain
LGPAPRERIARNTRSNPEGALLFTRLFVHDELLIRVLLQHTQAKQKFHGEALSRSTGARRSTSAGRLSVGPSDFPWDRYEFLIHDRDRIFADHLDESIARLGVKVLKSPPRRPMANAICERVIGTIRRACLDWLIPLPESHLRCVLKSWIPHYTTGRPHRAANQDRASRPQSMARTITGVQVPLAFSSIHTSRVPRPADLSHELAARRLRAPPGREPIEIRHSLCPPQFESPSR